MPERISAGWIESGSNSAPIETRGATNLDITGIYRDLPTLETERLVLRKVRVEDAADRFAYASDPEVARFMIWDTETDLQQSLAAVDYVVGLHREGRVAPWAVALRESDRMVGMAGYAWCMPRHGRAEVSFALNRAYWNRGLMTEAMEAILAFGFNQMDLNRVEAVVHPGNIASCRVVAKLGMIEEGRLRQVARINGVFEDHLIYAILRRDWHRRTL